MRCSREVYGGSENNGYAHVFLLEKMYFGILQCMINVFRLSSRDVNSAYKLETQERDL